MTVVDWDDSYSVGNDQIDADHRRIIALLNELHDAFVAAAPSAAIIRLFSRLEEATREHFLREEMILCDRGYEGLEAQRVQHRLLRDSLAALRGRLQAESPVGPAAAEVRDFLLQWFMSHVLDEDMEFRGVFRGTKPET